MFAILIHTAILLCALNWEYQDIKKVYAKRTVHDIIDPIEKEKEYKFYSTFIHDNNIMWRSLYISTVLSTVFIYFYLKNYSRGSVESHCFAILIIVFLTFYLVHMYRDFHFYRVLASKVRTDYYVMDNIGGKAKAPKKKTKSFTKKTI
jgi:hypothetical protein